MLLFVNIEFFYRGRFLIRRIRQDFDVSARKHDSIMTLVKDSLQKELSAQDESLEIEPEENDEVREKFYITEQ